MSKCKLTTEIVEWTIDPSQLDKNGDNKIEVTLYDKVEYAGRYKMDAKKECKTCPVTKKISLDKITKGSTSSVHTADGYINFHTHPISCYKGENTIWGWPSGEDMRETVGFMLRHNLCHMVFTMEGTYVVQTNPNFMGIIQSEKELIPGLPPNLLRGIVISLIESYFKCTHGHRGKDHNMSYQRKINHSIDPASSEYLTSKKWGICMPQDWVNFANNFSLHSVIDENASSCSNHLPCNGFPDKNGTITLEEHIDIYGIDKYVMTAKGTISEHSSKKYNKTILDKIPEIAKLFDEVVPSKSYGTEEWKRGQWFHCKIVYNNFKLPDSTFVPFAKWIELCSSQNPIKNICEYWNSCEKGSLQLNPVTVTFNNVSIPSGSTCSISENKT